MRSEKGNKNHAPQQFPVVLEQTDANNTRQIIASGLETWRRTPFVATGRSSLLVCTVTQLATKIDYNFVLAFHEANRTVPTDISRDTTVSYHGTKWQLAEGFFCFLKFLIDYVMHSVYPPVSVFGSKATIFAASPISTSPQLGRGRWSLSESLCAWRVNERQVVEYYIYGAPRESYNTNTTPWVQVIINILDPTLVVPSYNPSTNLEYNFF